MVHSELHALFSVYALDMGVVSDLTNFNYFSVKAAVITKIAPCYKISLEES